MPAINNAIINNIGAFHIENYLKEKGIKREENAGQELVYWINDLLDNKRIDISDFQDFLRDELNFGKRKDIRVYKLSKVRHYKFPSDWENKIKKYDIEFKPFNAILSVFPNEDKKIKIASLDYSLSNDGALKQLFILFVCLIYTDDDSKTYAYIPVTIDFDKSIMIFKAWNRRGIDKEDRTKDLLDRIYLKMLDDFNVEIKPVRYENKVTLYNMSLGLISDLYSIIPSYGKIGDLTDAINSFEQEVYAKLDLNNMDNTGTYRKLQSGVLDFNDDLRKEIEKLVVCDFFYDYSFDELLGKKLQTVMVKIRFSDEEQVLTSLSGENTDIPISCTKTFLALKKSLEEAKKVERIWIETIYDGKKLKIRFDASEGDYLNIMVLNQIHFSEKHLTRAMEIYHEYEC